MNDKENLIKSSQQVISYLAYESIQTSEDFEMIKTYCEKVLGRKAFHFISISTEIKLREEGVTASEFLNWFNNGFTGGDICEYNDSIVILSQSHRKWSKIAAILKDDKFLTSDKEVPTNTLKIAHKENIDLMRRYITENNLVYNPKTERLAPIYLPSEGEAVILFKKDVKGFGVVRKVDKDSSLVNMYCYVLDNGEYGYQNFMDYNFSTAEIVFSPATKRTLDSLNLRLRKYGKKWNGRLMRIEPVEYNRRTGIDGYYFLNSELKVEKAIDGGGRGTSSDIRFKQGNYFLDRHQAISLQARLRDAILDILSK